MKRDVPAKDTNIAKDIPPSRKTKKQEAYFYGKKQGKHKIFSFYGIDRSSLCGDDFGYRTTELWDGAGAFFGNAHADGIYR